MARINASFFLGMEHVFGLCANGWISFSGQQAKQRIVAMLAEQVRYEVFRRKEQKLVNPPAYNP